MKTFIYAILIFIAYLGALYAADQYNKNNNHPTLNEQAKFPDQLLIDMIISEQRDEKKQSLVKLENAIRSLWVLEKDVDREGAVLLEEAVLQLENLHKRLLIDSANKRFIRQTYQHVLSILASIELRVANDYLSSDAINKARIALCYANLHLKNATLFFDGGDEKQGDEIKTITSQLEKLIADNSAPRETNVTGLISLLDQTILKTKNQIQ